MGVSCFLLFSIHGLLSVFRQSMSVCACVFPVCLHVLAHAGICERDSLLHMLCWHLWCRRGRGVWRSSVCATDHMQLLLLTQPPHPFLPSKKTLVLSASALRSRCGISQRTRLQSDQLFKLQVSASGETHVYVYLWFLHISSLHTKKWLIMP